MTNINNIIDINSKNQKNINNNINVPKKIIQKNNLKTKGSTSPNKTLSQKNDHNLTNVNISNKLKLQSLDNKREKKSKRY